MTTGLWSKKRTGLDSRRGAKPCFQRKLRLYHHPNGARIAYREVGSGPPLVLLHSATLSHREFEPLIDELADRYRLVLPDLPLHGDSEDQQLYSYSTDWLVDVISSFIHDAGGPNPLVGGHEAGAKLILRAMEVGKLKPRRLILMPNSMHIRSRRDQLERAIRLATRAGAAPALDYALSHAARLVLHPALGERLSARNNPRARDLMRHAASKIAGNGTRMRGWARAGRNWAVPTPQELRDLYQRIDVPVLLLWADEDRTHPLVIAQEAVELFPSAQLRVLENTGFLMAYDDPVGMAREIAAFGCPYRKLEA